MAKMAATTAATTFAGSRLSAWPNSAATTTCTANAALTPSRTARAGYRVVSTRVATSVLSGSSTAKTSANAVAKARNSADNSWHTPFRDDGIAVRKGTPGDCWCELFRSVRAELSFVVQQDEYRCTVIFIFLSLSGVRDGKYVVLSLLLI